MTLWGLAGRNVVRRRRRYAPAMINLAFFGFAFTVLAGVGESALANLSARAEVYYGGQGTLLTYRLDSRGWDDTALGPDAVATQLSGFSWVKGVQARHVFRQPGTDVISERGTAPLRLIIGVDAEPGIEQKWDLVAGRRRPGPGELVVPVSTAHRLGLGVGDPLTLSFRTYTGQRNTARLTVAGVYHDDPVFGRGVAFADRTSVNRWTGKPAGYASELTLWVDGGLDQGRRDEVQQTLASSLPLWPHPVDKKTFLQQYPTEHWEGTKSVLFSLQDHTKDLQSALTALNWGVQLVSLLLLVVAALGLGSTLRVLLHERTVELGTIRALGMTEERTFGLLVLEVELVAALAVAGGVLLGTLSLLILSEVDLSQYKLIEPLLIGGTLGYHVDALPGVLAWAFAAVTVFFVSRPLVVARVSGPPAQSLGGSL